MRKGVISSVALMLGVVLAAGAQLACGDLLPGRSNGGATSGNARPAPHFEPGFNLFSPEQDVELGRRSAQEIARQLPLLNDAATVNFVRQLGAKLAAKAPGTKFPYQFNVVATKDINAFALPGGYVFVNAGAIAAAKNEGELAGVMAHEITHVALRHGTNQASKAYLAQRGLGIVGAIAGGRDSDFGQIINDVGGAGANMLFLRFGRTAERQADLEGARIMAEAGYDPRDMAAFFKTIQAISGQRTPEFLSDHPDPGNRIKSINDVLPSLAVSARPVHDSDAFEQIKARLTGASRSGSLNAGGEPARTGPRDPTENKNGQRPQPPAEAFREFRPRDGAYAFSYPQNWDALAAPGDEANLIFAPKGAYAQTDGSVVVTHGIFVGTIAPGSADLAAANDAFVRRQIEINPDYRIARAPQAINFGGRRGYATAVAGPSPVTGVVEVDIIYTTATADGRLFYLITIAPEDEFDNYQRAFTQIVGSLKLAR